MSANSDMAGVDPQNPRRNGEDFFALALCCVVPLLAVSNQSYWIDEALTAAKASALSLADWWKHMAVEKASDLQMPLYMFVTWAVAQIFGTAEWVLRAANLPWFVGGLAAFVFSYRGRQRIIAVMFGALSPFAWFYIDEARPYAMQLGASLLIAAALRRLHSSASEEARSNANWVGCFCLGLGVLAGASLLGVFWCAAALAILFCTVGSNRFAPLLNLSRGTWTVLGVWFSVLAGYYIWTLAVGARASAMATTNWQSPFFIVYELLGFSGLGPGRLQIREAGLAAFKPHLVLLGAYGVLLFVTLGLGAAAFWRRDARTTQRVGAIVLVTLVCLVAAGWLLHFRVLGRHCAPALPVILVLLVEGARALSAARFAFRRWVMAAVLVVTVASCLSVRFGRRHRKDDYRAAAACARTALESGKSVWWSADAQGASFYGLLVGSGQAGKGVAKWVVNSDDALLAAERLPDVIICSKPDLYDSRGALARRLKSAKQEGFREIADFPAFKVWGRDGSAESHPAR